MYVSNQSFVDAAASNASVLQSPADASSFTQYITGTDTASMHAASSAAKSIVMTFIETYRFYDIHMEKS